jgi:hypothetical protein
MQPRAEVLDLQLIGGFTESGEVGVGFDVILIVLVVPSADAAVLVLAAWLGEELSEGGLTI